MNYMKNKKAYIVVGIGHGDEGKGTVTDYITSVTKSSLVVRFSGGAQCAHNVHVRNKHFCFKQLSAGTFAGADTLLLDSVIVNPILLIHEMRDFESKFGFLPKVYVHENALVTTPYHIYANRIEEKVNNHGSVGLGIYKTVEYAQKYNPLKIGDLSSIRNSFLDIHIFDIISNFRDEIGPKDYEKDENWEGLFVDDHEEEQDLISIYKNIEAFITIVNDEDCKKLINNSEIVVFEGAQGALLDKDRGFLPHVSATDTTTQLAEDFLKRIDYDGHILRIGITRSYATRHGNGPLPTEVKGIVLKGEDNTYNEWQKGFRVGTLDYDSLRYALSFTKVDKLFVTCLDNDPFYKDEFYLSRAFGIAIELKLPLFGYSFGKDRSHKILM
jgi:adenylosuccinate synthase